MQEMGIMMTSLDFMQVSYHVVNGQIETVALGKF